MSSISINATAGGWVSSSNATYLTARAGGTLVAGNMGSNEGIGQRADGTPYGIFEGFLEFDLSVLSGLTPTGAVLRLSANAGGLPSPNLALIAYQRDWGGGTLTTADYFPGADLSGLTELASLDSDDAVGSYVDMTNTGGALLAAIGGATLRICLATDEETNASVPPGGEARVVNIGLLGGGEVAQLIVEVPGGYPKVMMF